MTVVLSRNAASELVEIFKHLDKEILKKIPKELIKNIRKRSNENYFFEYDSTKKYTEQKISAEARLAMARIYLTYCCANKQANELIQINNRAYMQKKSRQDGRIDSDDIMSPIHTEVKAIPTPMGANPAADAYRVNSAVQIQPEDLQGMYTEPNVNINTNAFANTQVPGQQQLVEKKQNIFTKFFESIKRLFGRKSG